MKTIDLGTHIIEVRNIRGLYEATLRESGGRFIESYGPRRTESAVVTEAMSDLYEHQTLMDTALLSLVK